MSEETILEGMIRDLSGNISELKQLFSAFCIETVAHFERNDMRLEALEKCRQKESDRKKEKSDWFKWVVIALFGLLNVINLIKGWL
jgi:hypothetical protein